MAKTSKLSNQILTGSEKSVTELRAKFWQPMLSNYIWQDFRFCQHPFEVESLNHISKLRFYSHSSTSNPPTSLLRLRLDQKDKKVVRADLRHLGKIKRFNDRVGKDLGEAPIPDRINQDEWGYHFRIWAICCQIITGLKGLLMTPATPIAAK